MKKNFLLLLLMTLLPLAGWSANIAVQLSTSLQKVYGTADPTTLSPTQFVIIADGGATVTEADIAQYLTFKRKPGSTGESVGTYDWEVEVSDGWAGAPIVATNTGRISITPLDLSTAPISAGWTGDPFTYDGNAKEPTVTSVQVGVFTLDPSDYTVSYEDNINAGPAKIIITAASGNVTGSNIIPFTINKRTLSSVTIADIADLTYNKVAQEPELTVTADDDALALTTDYTVVYTDNTNASETAPKATITLSENYDYTGDVSALTKGFKILPKSLTSGDITHYISAAWKPVFNGKDKTLPSSSINYLKDGDDNIATTNYTRTIANHGDRKNATVNVAEADKPYILFTGQNNYTGEYKMYYTIAQKPLSECTIADITPLTYDGADKTPELEVSFNNGEVVTLTKDVDYTVSYENNTTAGTATATITAVDGTNYTGSAIKEFTINPVTVYIRPVDQSKFYGQADPNFAQPTTAMYELVDGEGNAVEGAVLNGTVALGRKAGETVGNYDIYVKSYTVNPEVKDNYSPSNTYYTNDENLGSHTATFTINAQEAKLILKFKEGTPATKVYGDPTYAYSVDDLEVVSGLAGSDTWETLKGGATFTPTLESEDVHFDGNKVTATITGLANYPNIEVQPLAFTVTKRPFGVKVSAQTKDYGKAIAKAKTYWAKAAASTYAFDGTPEQEGKDDVLVELYTDEDVATFAPNSVNEGVIKARIADESNYELDLENSAWGTLTINAATELALDDSKDDNLTQIAAFDGQTVNVTIDFSSRNGRNLGAERNWEKENWVTMTLPFDISVADLSKALGYAIVNVIDPSKTVINGTSSEFYGKLTMKGGNGKDDVLAANKPFLVKTADDINGVIDFGTQTVVAPSEDLSVDAGLGAKFVGTYETKTVTKDDNANIWFMLGNLAKWAFITSDATWNIVPFEAYIDMTSMPAGAPRNITFFFEEIDGSTTAIKSIETDNQSSQQSAEGWYTLNGVKLMSAPTQKGVYIKDGKKVVVK